MMQIAGLAGGDAEVRNDAHDVAAVVSWANTSTEYAPLLFTSRTYSYSTIQAFQRAIRSHFHLITVVALNSLHTHILCFHN
jgi:hypothetical protein